MADKHIDFTVNYQNLSVYDEFNADKIQYPLILSIPHSGTFFPPEFLQNVRFPEKILRRNEDLLVDELLKGALDKGLTALKMNITRTFVDLNRDRLELDPTMFYNYPKEKDILYDKHCRVGLGVIHRINFKRENLYDGLLNYHEAEERLSKVYDVYHNRLQQLINKCLKKFGFCVVLDCHSMPSKICSIIDDRSGIDVCLGNLFSQSCLQEYSDFLAAQFWDYNYNVQENCPYSGAYITFNYCQPRRKMYTLQLELNRSLYADEDNLCKNAEFDEVSEEVSTAVINFAEYLKRQ